MQRQVGVPSSLVLGDPGADDAVRSLRHGVGRAPGRAEPWTRRLIDFLAATVRIATPLLFAALGGILSERAGTFAVGLEGMMLAGAFGGAVGDVSLRQPVARPARQLPSAAHASRLIVAIATARFDAEQMVTGLAANILALGLTSFLLRSVVGGGQAPVIQIALLPPLPMPVSGRHPRGRPAPVPAAAAHLSGALLRDRDPIFLCRHARSGLMLRAVGENPHAAFAVGTDPIRVRHGGDRRRAAHRGPRRRGARRCSRSAPSPTA